MAGTAQGPGLYRMIWRWHFYAGLFVLPFVLVLSLTGAVYLFRPQIDRWEERAYRGLATGGAVSPDRQRDAALAAFPQARFVHYRLPERPGDAALLQLALPDGAEREVFVSPQGSVLASRVPESGISATIARLHGNLLLGRWGDRLVELAASWTIVLVLSGLYLWWPRPLRAAGTLWPRPHLRGRALLKDLHRVTGFWIAGLLLVTLVSGLPWAGAWGGTFAWVREQLHLVQGPADWKIGTPAAPAGHAHHAMAPHGMMPPAHALPLSVIVAKAQAERMAFPVTVRPPLAPPQGRVSEDCAWLVRSSPANRVLARQVSYDTVSGAGVARSGFADRHVIDRIVNTGIAWHEGQLFGLANQLAGLAMALGLIAVSILGTVMWLRRRPLGAPPAPVGKAPRWLVGATALLGLLMPLFGLSLIVVLLIDAGLTAAGRARRSAG